MNRIAKAVLVILAASVVVTVVGVRFSRGTSPCPAYQPVDLTGTLVEVRRDGVTAPSDDPVFSVLPRVVCLAPANVVPTNAGAIVSDCYEPEFEVRVTVGGR